MSSWSLNILLKHGLGDKAIESGQSSFPVGFGIEESCRELDSAYDSVVKQRDAIGAEWKDREKLWAEMMARQTAATESALKQRDHFMHCLQLEVERAGKLVEALKQMAMPVPETANTTEIERLMTLKAQQVLAEYESTQRESK